MLRYQPARCTPPKRWRHGACAQDPQGRERWCLEQVHYNPIVQQIYTARFKQFVLLWWAHLNICLAMNIPPIPKSTRMASGTKRESLTHSNLRNHTPTTNYDPWKSLRMPNSHNSVHLHLLHSNLGRPSMGFYVHYLHIKYCFSCVFMYGPVSAYTLGCFL